MIKENEAEDLDMNNITLMEIDADYKPELGNEMRENNPFRSSPLSTIASQPEKAKPVNQTLSNSGMSQRMRFKMMVNYAIYRIPPINLPICRPISLTTQLVIHK